jgi:hypothetical protein
MIRRLAHGTSERASAAVWKKVETQRQALRARIRAYTVWLRRLNVCPVVMTLPARGSPTSLVSEAVLVKEVLEEFNTDGVLGQEDREDYDSDTDDSSEVDDLDAAMIDMEEDNTNLEESVFSSTKPEQLHVWLPSHNSTGISPDVCRIELHLRRALALECLQKIRNGIGEKSVLIRYLVRRNRDAGQHKRGRAWKEVSTVHAQLVKNWALYRQSQVAITHLPNAAEEQKQFQPIEREDLRDLKDITSSNRFNQRSDTLPWFWMMHGVGTGTHDVMYEGM